MYVPFYGPWFFLSMFAFLIPSAEQQQCVAYSSACYLKCPSAKLKQMRWHSARTDLNSAMTQTFCPKTLAGFAMSNFAELVCSPSPHLLLISRRQGKRSRKCQKPSNKSHCLQRKRGVCLCTNNNTASSLRAVIIFPCKSFAGFLHFVFCLENIYLENDLI